MDIIRTEGLSRHYAMGEATIHALRGIDLTARQELLPRGAGGLERGPALCGGEARGHGSLADLELGEPGVEGAAGAQELGSSGRAAAGAGQ